MPSGHPALFASASYSFLLVLCIDRDHHFVCLYLCICISLLLLVVLHILIRSSFCVSACIVYIQSKMQAPSSELFWPSCCQARQVSLLKAPHFLHFHSAQQHTQLLSAVLLSTKYMCRSVVGHHVDTSGHSHISIFFKRIRNLTGQANAP